MAPILMAAYRWPPFRPGIRWLIGRLEGGIMCSVTQRRIFEVYEGVRIGPYSCGAGIRPGLFARGTVIGNFSCFAIGLQVLRRNHAAARFSQHPLFFNPLFGLVAQDARPDAHSNHLTIGSDVWTGLNVIICPGCRSIGDGAIVGAGAVVTKDVPPYTIVAGNPAKPIRKRYAPEVEAVVAASAWWLRPLPELVEHLDLFTQDITEVTLARFAAAFPPRPKADGPQSSKPSPKSFRPPMTRIHTDGPPEKI